MPQGFVQVQLNPAAIPPLRGEYTPPFFGTSSYSPPPGGAPVYVPPSSTTEFFVCLAQNGADFQSRRSVRVPSNNSHSVGYGEGAPAPGAYTFRAYSAQTGGGPLYESAAIVVPEVGTLTGVPSAGTVGSALVGTGAGGTISFTTVNVATPYVALVTGAATVGQAVGSARVGAAVALPTSDYSGTVPAPTPPSAGTIYLALLNGPAGAVLARSGAITVAAAVQSGSFSGVPSSATAGVALVGTGAGNAITFTASNIGSPYAALVANAAAVGQPVGSNLVGPAVALSGTSGTVPAITPPAAGTVCLALLNAATGTIIARSGSITVAAAATPPTTQSGGGVTLSGVPASIVAGQPLSGVTFSFSTEVGNGQIVLYNVTSGVEEGPRLLSSSLPANDLGLFIPQANALYTVRVRNYDNTSVLFESTQISVSAAPGALPSRVTQMADTNRTSSSVTVNWTATAPSYRVLARPGIATTAAWWTRRYRPTASP